MSGKASLIVILGFSMLFMVIGGKFSGVSGRMTDNYVNYYTETISHNIASSGANLAANQIYLDPTWTAGYNQNYQNGTMLVQVNIINAFKNIRQIVSRGIFNKDTSIVRVTLSPSKFSKFAYYSISEGGTIWWMARDTVWGPFHTQDYLRASRHPTFYGKATSNKRIIYETNKNTDKPNFYGGYESGVDLPLPVGGVNALRTPAETAGGLYFTGHDTVHMEFRRDTLYTKYTWNGSITKRYLPAVASNGLIYANNAIIRLKGIVKGAYSVVSGGTYSSKGRIYIDDDIVYDKDPRVYATSTDMLGIIAKEEVVITKNSVNNDNVNIHGSIYVEDGGFGAEDYDDRPVSGTINLLGGIIQHTRRAVGTFSGSSINHGFSKSYRYDDRFMLASPPFFPGTGGFEIVSWYE